MVEDAEVIDASVNENLRFLREDDALREGMEILREAPIQDSKVERMSQGLKGGVIGIILLASFPLPAGTTVLGALGGTPLPWFDINVTLPPSLPFNPFS